MYMDRLVIYVISSVDVRHCLITFLCIFPENHGNYLWTERILEPNGLITETLNVSLNILTTESWKWKRQWPSLCVQYSTGKLRHPGVHVLATWRKPYTQKQLQMRDMHPEGTSTTWWRWSSKKKKKKTSTWTPGPVVIPLAHCTAHMIDVIRFISQWFKVVADWCHFTIPVECLWSVDSVICLLDRHFTFFTWVLSWFHRHLCT